MRSSIVFMEFFHDFRAMVMEAYTLLALVRFGGYTGVRLTPYLSIRRCECRAPTKIKTRQLVEVITADGPAHDLIRRRHAA